MVDDVDQFTPFQVGALEQGRRDRSAALGAAHPTLTHRVLVDAAGRDQASSEHLVPERRRDGLDTSSREIQRHHLFEVLHLEKAGAPLLRKELQDGDERELAYFSPKNHDEIVYHILRMPALDMKRIAPLRIPDSVTRVGRGADIGR